MEGIEVDLRAVGSTGLSGIVWYTCFSVGIEYDGSFQPKFIKEARRGSSIVKT